MTTFVEADRIERMARALCIRRGLDPDGLKRSARPIGNLVSVHTQKHWESLVPEVIAWSTLFEAYQQPAEPQPPVAVPYELQAFAQFVLRMRGGLEATQRLSDVGLRDGIRVDLAALADFIDRFNVKALAEGRR